MALIAKLRKNLSEIQLEIGSFKNNLYPTFVTSRSPETIRNEVPVFVFHSFEPKLFEEQLEFLSVNGYYTLTCDEFHGFLTGRKRIPEKSILLTIDDGRSSVWTYAYPLLKKYGFKATVFIIPGYTKEADRYYANLEDYWSGKVPMEEVKNRDKSDAPLLNWDEIYKIHETGLIDFQSHSLYHHKVFTSPEIMGFFNPSNDQPLYDLVLPYSYEHDFHYAFRDQLFGMPIYTSNSIMSGEFRYFDDEDLRLDCMNYVSENGGRQFFSQKGWQVAMRERVEKHKRKYRLSDRLATPEERNQEILNNLTSSKRIIEERLSKKVVSHFCFPYGIGSDICVEISKAAGYVTNLWSHMLGRRTNRPGDDPFYCVRLKNDFIFRLPGIGRKSLFEILKFKLTRRLSGEFIY